MQAKPFAPEDEEYPVLRFSVDFPADIRCFFSLGRSILQEFKADAKGSGDKLHLADHPIQQHHSPLRAWLPAVLCHQPAPR